MEIQLRLCPICVSEKHKEVYSQSFDNYLEFSDGYTQKIVICEDCGFVFNNPCPSYAELEKHYTFFSNYESPQTEGKATPEMTLKWNRTFDMVSESFPNNFKGKALEIGCATAFGLSVFKSNGWDVLGLDPSKKAVEIAKELYGIEVIEALFDKSLFEGQKFDVIIFSHVLEHIVSPDELIKDLTQILKPNGFVYIEVPNMLKPDVPMGWFTFEHLNYYTPTSLTNLMEVNSFELAKMKLFDGSMAIQPFYPVISSLYRAKKSEKEHIIVNDFEKSSNAVFEYITTTKNEGRKINDKIESVLKKFSPGKIALWAAGIHTSQLLSLTGLSKTSIGFIFDSDSKKQGQILCNIVVRGLEQDDISKIECVIISSRAFEKEIYEQIKYLELYGIQIVKLYS